MRFTKTTTSHICVCLRFCRKPWFQCCSPKAYVFLMFLVCSPEAWISSRFLWCFSVWWGSSFLSAGEQACFEVYLWWSEDCRLKAGEQISKYPKWSKSFRRCLKMKQKLSSCCGFRKSCYLKWASGGKSWISEASTCFRGRSKMKQKLSSGPKVSDCRLKRCCFHQKPRLSFFRCWPES